MDTAFAPTQLLARIGDQSWRASDVNALTLPHDPMIITVDDSGKYLPTLLAGLMRNHSVMIMDERWPDAYKQSCKDIAQTIPPLQGKAFIATSGSSGTPKMCQLAIPSLFTSAKRSVMNGDFTDVQGLLLAIRPSSMGGLLTVVRGLLRQIPIICPSHQRWYHVIPEYQRLHIALVPSQLQRIADIPTPNRHIHTLLIGGDRIHPQDWARIHTWHIPVSVSYGLTETAGQVVATPYQHFSPNESPSHHMAPLGDVAIDGHSDGRLKVKVPTLAEGYITHNGPTPLPMTTDGYLLTNDIVSLSPFEVLGRSDFQFQNGAKLVNPEYVERHILASGWVNRALVIPEPDPRLGHVPIAIVDSLTHVDAIRAYVQECLPIHMRPVAYRLGTPDMWTRPRNHSY